MKLYCAPGACSLVDHIVLYETRLSSTTSTQDAMRVARQSDLVAAVPRSCFGQFPAQADLQPTGLRVFDLPFVAPALVVSVMWHPRLDADAAQRWFRSTMMSVCRTAAAPQ